MDILLINPPHPSIGSRIPREHLPPLGLLSVGGPLIDAGHRVRLLDAEFGPMSTREIVKEVVTLAPQAVLIGHSGSTSGHPVAAEITRAIRAALPKTWIIYGGVFPTYHWREVLSEEPQIRDQHQKDGPTPAEFWGMSQGSEEVMKSHAGSPSIWAVRISEH
jgi:anaerobic magnesium-protoporphyrin IX monomethyl ester cyclase